MPKTTKPKKSVKKSTTKNKVITGKNKFSPSPKQRIIILVAAVVALVVAGYATLTIYQNNQSDAYTCVQRNRSQGSSSACTRYMLNVLRKAGKTSLGGSVFGPKVATLVRSINGNGSAVVTNSTWVKICHYAISSTGTIKAKSDFHSLGCKSVTPASYFKKSTNCSQAGYYWGSGKNKCNSKPASSFKAGAACTAAGYYSVSTSGSYCSNKKQSQSNKPYPWDVTSRDKCVQYGYWWGIYKQRGTCHWKPSMIPHDKRTCEQIDYKWSNFGCGSY